MAAHTLYKVSRLATISFCIKARRDLASAAKRDEIDACLLILIHVHRHTRAHTHTSSTSTLTAEIMSLKVVLFNGVPIDFRRTVENVLGLLDSKLTC